MKKKVSRSSRCKFLFGQTRRNITPQQSQRDFNFEKKVEIQRNDSYENLSFSPLLCFQKISRKGS